MRIPTMNEPEAPSGWSWFEPSPPGRDDRAELEIACAACFAGRHGQIVLDHLKAVFLDRRVPPSASDAELRHVEGQRSAVDYLMRLIRAREGRAQPDGN